MYLNVSTFVGICRTEEDSGDKVEMKIGIEEEFLVVDPKTLFCTPGAPRIANSLVYRNKKYINKCSVELPFHSESIKSSIKEAKKGFCVIEIKTDPHEDIDKLKHELKHLREDLVQVTKENRLLLIPSGLHPMYSKENSLSDNCAALHLHIQGVNQDFYNRILSKVPFLISISTNSPLYEGKIKAMSNRALISSHIGIPKNHFDRESDLLINNSLQTIEIRNLDTQITLEETIGLASIYRTIAQNDLFKRNISRQEYLEKRQRSIWNGRNGMSISDEEYDILISTDKYSKQILEQENGSNWQIKVFKKHGLGSVILSLWESFESNERKIRTTTKEIEIKQINTFNLFYLLLYSPFFFLEKFKKYHQDISPLKNMKLEKEAVFVN